jgi:hypothetical protein
MEACEAAVNMREEARSSLVIVLLLVIILDIPL